MGNIFYATIQISTNAPSNNSSPTISKIMMAVQHCLHHAGKSDDKFSKMFSGTSAQNPRMHDIPTLKRIDMHACV